jgi:hypothetical protein
MKATGEVNEQEIDAMFIAVKKHWGSPLTRPPLDVTFINVIRIPWNLLIACGISRAIGKKHLNQFAVRAVKACIEDVCEHVRQAAVSPPGSS